MKLQYDDQIRLAGIGVVPWTRLGLERWFPNYKIASLCGWDITNSDAPDVASLADYDASAHPTKQNTAHLLAEPSFRTMLQQQFTGYDLLTYKAVKQPLLVPGIHIISGDQTLAARLENKAAFRQLMHDSDIPFPAYKVLDRRVVKVRDLNAILAGRQSVIIQDEQLSNGKGTFVVSDERSFARALTTLERLSSASQLVVSERISPAHERSVQCCVTRYGVFVGPLQKQIIAEPLLTNTDQPGSALFCGAEITPDDPYAAAYDDIRRYAVTVGQIIGQLGYKGIFSLDCLVTDAGQVFVLEINPRITGITPLITMLYRSEQDIPFYALHALELAGLDYTISDDTIDPIGPTGSLMIIHNRSHQAVSVAPELRSGIYRTSPLSFQESAYRFTQDMSVDDMLLQRYTPHGISKPGGRLANVFSSNTVLDLHDQLSPQSADLLSAIRSQISKEVAT